MNHPAGEEREAAADPGGSSSGEAPRSGRASRLWRSPRVRLALLGVLLAAGATAAFVFAPSTGSIEGIVDDAGVLAPIAFVALYAALTVLLFPGAAMTAAAGVLFGVAGGTVLAVVGATLGAVASFIVGRRLGRRQVEEIAGRRIGELDRRLERRGFLAVLYLRLVPLVPFNALNYAAGVSAVRRRDYVAATAIGIVPATFAYAALGSSLGDPTSPEFIGAVALVIVLAAGAPVVERVRRRCGRRRDEAEEARATSAR